MKTSEVLNKAADLIEKRGWTTGTYRAMSQKVCLESALALSQGVGGGYDEAWEFANTCPAGVALREFLDLGDWSHSSFRSLWFWNDKQATAEQVIATLRAAAVIEAARENADARQAVQA